MARRIPLTKDAYAIVDDEDFDWLSKYSWCFHVTGYAKRGRKEKGKSITIFMHKEILEVGKESCVDHINGNQLDNRKENLRKASYAENARNSYPQKGSYSDFKGVSRHKKTSRWRTKIFFDGKEHSLGVYDNETDAAKAYDDKAKEFFGPYAKLNFIND